MAEVSEKIANRYQILEIIGQGGMGIVYKAQDELLNRIVAIKSIPSPKGDEDSKARSDLISNLLNEAQVMASVQHPNICAVYDLIAENDILYIVMPLLRRNASDWLSKTAPQQPLIELLRFIDRIADALDFLHRHSIIHQDLKPANILLSDDDQPYIVDFGLSEKLEADAKARNAQFAGTLAYISPEVLRQSPSTSARDIYAFGLMVFEILAGHNPYLGLPIHDLLPKILNSALPSIKSFRPELTSAAARDIDEVIAKLTAKNPDDRYKTALDAVNVLHRIINGGKQIIEGKLYISYSHDDKAFVYALTDELERYNVDFWIDTKLNAGEAWEDALDTQLDSCDAILVITTDASMEAPYVTYEWSYFIGAKKPVFPLVLKSPSDMKIHPRLSRMQFIRGSDDIAYNVRKIIQSLSLAMASRSNGE